MSRIPHTTSLHLQDFEPDQLLGVVRDARFEHYILAHTKCSARFRRWTCGDFSVDIGHYNFPVRAVGLFPSTKLCIGYMRSFNEMTWVNGFQVTPKTLEYYPKGSELNYRATSGGEWVAIEFEEATLQRVARTRLGCEMDLPWKHITSFFLCGEARAALDRMIRLLWRHPASGEAMIQPILGVIVETLRDFQQGGSSSRTRSDWSRRQTMLKRADDFLRSNPGSPFDLSNLALAAGTTPRTLQREFSQAFGLTPLKWARCLALHQMRNLLTQPERRKFTVEAIAFQCGFRHMGRFAGYYQELFGESPCRTRRKLQPPNSSQ